MCVPLSEAPPGGGNGVCTLSDGSLGRLHDRAREPLEGAPRPRLRRPALRLPGRRLDPRLLRQAVPAGLREELRAELGAADPVRSAYLTQELRRRLGQPALRAQRDLLRGDRRAGADPVARVLPPDGAASATRPFFLGAAVLALGALRQQGRRPAARDVRPRSTCNPVLSLPVEGDPLAVGDGAGGRAADRATRTRPTTGSRRSSGSRFCARTREAGVSLVGPSFSRIYDVSLGPWGKFKHVIEPRVDYTYVSNVSDPARIPAFDEIDTTLGQNQIRYAIVNRLLAAAGRPGGLGRGDRLARDRADLRLQLPQTIFLPAAGVVQRQSGPVEAILRRGAGGRPPPRRAAPVRHPSPRRSPTRR